LVEFESRSLGNIRTELRAEFGHVVGEEYGLVAGAGDGDIAKAGVEQVRVDAGVGVHKDTFSGETLRTVAGHGVTVVEVAMVLGVEFDLAVAVEAG
jgi:hypothetical protein